MKGDLVAFICGALLGACIGGAIVGSYYQREGVEHGAAHYDSQTGKWQWNEPEVTE